MYPDEMSPEQQRDAEAMHVEFEQQLARVGVDLRAASLPMNELEEPVRQDVVGDEDSA